MDANHLSTRFMPVSADSPHLVAAAALCVLALMSCLAHADLKGPCVASADDRPRIALISAFSNEATAYIAQMQRDDAANHFQGCVVINGYRFVKGRLRGQEAAPNVLRHRGREPITGSAGSARRTPWWRNPPVI
jgi:hypothetical protein